MKFRITGAHKDTGEPATLELEADNQDAAESQAFDQGILISNTVKLEPPLVPKEMRIPLIGLTGTVLFCFIVAVTMLPKSQPQPKHQSVPTASQPEIDYSNHPLAEFSPDIIDLVYNGTFNDWLGLGTQQKELLSAAFSKHFSTKNLNHSASTMLNCLENSINQDDPKVYEYTKKSKMISMLAMTLLVFKNLTRSPMDKIMNRLESAVIYDLGMTPNTFREKLNQSFTREFTWKLHPESTDKWQRMVGVYKQTPSIKVNYIARNQAVYAVELRTTVPDRLNATDEDFGAEIASLDAMAVQTFPLKSSMKWIVKSFIDKKGDEIKNGISSSQYGYKIDFSMVIADSEVRYYLLITREKPW
ncbi:MAG: hypothetical protein JKX85_10465 [Phycisphaeraceae bacterium]|nr:hypothetical protein [Phycisphaeraceae bacterium]